MDVGFVADGLGKVPDEVPLWSDLHGIPIEGDICWPVAETFMMLRSQNYVSVRNSLLDMNVI